MRDVVQAEVMMSFVISEELAFRIPVELEYDMADPLAVRLTFHLPGDAPVTWTFARELLLDGLYRPTGEGDVRIAPIAPGHLADVLIRLRAGDESAVFRAGAAPLMAFLDLADRLVPLGDEWVSGDIDGHIDAELARILTEDQKTG